MTRNLVLLSVLAALAGGASGCDSSAQTAQSKTRIAQLQSIDQLRRTFDAHSGVPRLILLISPT
jgi:hypothetical protein